MDGALPEMPEMAHGPGRPPGAHLPWGIRMERSDAAAWENEEQRKSDYISYALVQQELLANKSLALQSAMQQQINSAWELHASEHVACSYGPSPLQQVQHHEVEYIDIQHRFKLTVWQCTSCAACANPIRFHCWPSSQRQASIWYDISLLRHFMEAWFAGLSEDAYLKSLSFTHYPLTLYPPKPIKTASFSAAFFDYLRVTHRASTMAELVGSCHADMLPSGAVADCPLCASLPGAPPEDGYIRTLSADACLQPSSYAGAARATRHIKQHINTYLDPSGLEGDVLKLQASNQLTLKGAFAAAAAQSSGASAGGADLADPDGASEATADVSSHAADCSASLSCARPHTSNVSAGQPCDIRGIVGFVCCHGIAVPQLFCNMRTPEQFVYYLLAMARLVHMCFGLVLHVYIDFACQFKVTWARYARVVGLDTARTHLMVNWMHGASHDLGCQLKNNGRYLATAAWRVGEQTEQLWSMFKAMSPLLRYMTRANRADAVQARLSAIAFNKQADMLAALEKQHKSMLKKEEELNQKISDLRARAFADGVTDEALARKAFVDSYLNPEACSVRPNDWWLAVWVQLLLELKALEAVAFGLSLEGARSPIRLPSVTLQPDFAQLLTRRTGKATHEQRLQVARARCMQLELQHGINPQECFQPASATIARGLQLLQEDKLTKYRTSAQQLAMEACEIGLRRDELGQKGQATQALNKSIKAKLKQARVLLDEMSHWQVLGTTQQLADVRVTDEQLQAMVLGQPPSWKESTGTDQGKLLHYGRQLHQLLSDSDRCTEQLAVLHVEQGRLQSWLQHMIQVCERVAAEPAAQQGQLFYLQQHHSHYTAMLEKANGLLLGRAPAPA
ncbi:hypothetical protein QJQ45_000171 [Haematococcus lacustris]|nr:hypothetical protein QJQ45_000171 [Haematococcus lacustris]